MYILTNCSPAYSKCTGNVFKMHPFLYKFAYLFNFNMHARISSFPFWRGFNPKLTPPLLSVFLCTLIFRYIDNGAMVNTQRI